MLTSLTKTLELCRREIPSTADKPRRFVIPRYSSNYTISAPRDSSGHYISDLAERVYENIKGIFENKEFFDYLCNGDKCRIGPFEKSYIDLIRFSNSGAKSRFLDSMKMQHVYLFHQQFTDKDIHYLLTYRMGRNLSRKSSDSRFFLINPFVDLLRQHKVDREESHDAEDFAELCELAGYSDYFIADVHFSEASTTSSPRCSMGILSYNSVLTKSVIENYRDKLAQYVVFGADYGARPLSSGVSRILGLREGVILKARPAPDVTQIDGCLVDDRLKKHLKKYKKAILVDDIVGTGGTSVGDMNYLRNEFGVEEFIVLISHPDCSKGAGIEKERETMNKLYNACVENNATLYTTDDVYHELTDEQKTRIKVISTAEFFSDNIIVHALGGSLQKYREIRNKDVIELRKQYYETELDKAA
ncbi:MAG: phosphoribosyltransferase family protein [Candidatus Aenigmatarchaeota archaeon]